MAALLDDLVEGRVLAWVDLMIGLGLVLIMLSSILIVRRIDRARGEYARQAAAQEAILETGSALGDPQASAQVLDRICAHACAILGVEKAAVFTRATDDPRTYFAQAGHGVPDSLIGYRLPIDTGMPGEVLANGEAILIDDYQSFMRPIPHEVAEDLRASASVPIHWDGIVQGALSVGTTRAERSLTDPDLKALCRLADLAGIALQQAIARDRAERMLMDGAQGLAVAIDLRDNYTAEHSYEVVGLASRVGKHLGIAGSELYDLELGAKLHDIGKIGIPDSILQKDGALDEDEWQEMKCHPVYGERILAPIPGFEWIARIVRAEHEHWDGGGYPDGLAGEEIPRASRIILACDAYHAMTSHRPYRDALSEDVAVRRLRRGSGTQFDPAVVEALLSVLRVEGIVGARSA